MSSPTIAVVWAAPSGRKLGAFETTSRRRDVCAPPPGATWKGGPAPCSESKKLSGLVGGQDAEGGERWECFIGDPGVYFAKTK